MASGPRYRVPFRRRREGLTNYRFRRSILRGGVPRAVVRKSLNQTTAQIIEFGIEGDRILVSALGNDLKKMGWKWSNSNIPASYLTGYLLGVRALDKGIKEAVLDINMERPIKGSKIFACLKGMIDAGLDVPYGDEEIFPPEDRLKGTHIDEKMAQDIERIISEMKKEG